MTNEKKYSADKIFLSKANFTHLISNEVGKMMCVTKKNSTTQIKTVFIFFKTLVFILHGFSSRYWFDLQALKSLSIT